MEKFEATVNVGREIAEIARDFERPLEVLREALHNSYDAEAGEVRITARAETLETGNRVLSIDVSDDGSGMDEDMLKGFFGLGHSKKPDSAVRPPIGFKGHGTKIFYQSLDLWVATRRPGSELLVARLPQARAGVVNQRIPAVEVYRGNEAQQQIDRLKLVTPLSRGTAIRLIDFTTNSDRLIDTFREFTVENYLRWFTVFGSFRHAVYPNGSAAPLRLWLQGTDKDAPRQLDFGHDWPLADQVVLKALKARDERRPFNFFRKTFRGQALSTSGGYKVDIAVLFEGRRGRQERDQAIRRQGPVPAGVVRLYHEEERYGLWLCKDFIPIEPRFDWLNEDELTEYTHLQHLLRSNRPLIAVNCQDFWLTANRGSVGNSPDKLLEVIKQAAFDFIRQSLDDKDVANFLNESQEDMFERLREKDKKALQKRIDRYNKKARYEVQLPNGKTHQFFEPGREITLFGLICELHLLDPGLLELDILDYDDHFGLDILVRRNGNPGDLLNKTRVAYTELKSKLETRINHPFDNKHSIICWESLVDDNDKVYDPTGTDFTYRVEQAPDGLTHSRLIPSLNSTLSHNVKVIVLKRFLQEKCHLKAIPAARITTSAGSAAKPTRPRKKKPGS